MGTAQKILLVAQDAARAGRLETLLRRYDLNFRCAATGGQALQDYETWPADLIITEFQLEGLQELQLVELIRRMNSRAHFIVLLPADKDINQDRFTENRIVTYVPENAGDGDISMHIQRCLSMSDNPANRRQFSRFKLSIDTHCILINPFNNSESRPIPGLIRDVSRSGLSMIVRQLIPVPAMLKLIVELPQTRRSITMLAKSLSCTLTQIPNVYRLGAKFVGLLPPEMEDAIGELDESGLADRSDIFMGKSFKRAVEEWLENHQENLGDHGLEPGGTPLPRVADEVCMTPAEHEKV